MEKFPIDDILTPRSYDLVVVNCWWLVHNGYVFRSRSVYWQHYHHRDIALRTSKTFPEGTEVVKIPLAYIAND